MPLVLKHMYLLRSSTHLFRVFLSFVTWLYVQKDMNRPRLLETALNDSWPVCFSVRFDRWGGQAKTLRQALPCIMGTLPGWTHWLVSPTVFLSFSLSPSPLLLPLLSTSWIRFHSTFCTLLKPLISMGNWRRIGVRDKDDNVIWKKKEGKETRQDKVKN